MSIRAIRGATALQSDNAVEMVDAVVELLTEMMAANHLTSDDLVSIFFTATPDIHSAFPAAAARKLDIADVPLICAQELDITGAMKLVIRVMMQAQTTAPRADIVHVYQRGTQVLRQDLTP
jgi:chorismate mutase